MEDDGEERPEREGYLFAYCCVNSEDPYFQAVEKSIRVSLQKEDAELLVMDAKGDVALQSRQIQELIDERVDAVFLTPMAATPRKCWRLSRRRRYRSSTSTSG